tara:strand:+ start:313 stop:465 length:153 start_codon:yes stop_codon:yes gene_type:complete
MNRKRAELLKELLSFNDYTEQKLLEQFQKEKTLKITQKKSGLRKSVSMSF